MFLMFFEAMSMFMNVEQVQLKGLVLPISHQDLVDAELEDDTVLCARGCG